MSKVNANKVRRLNRFLVIMAIFVGGYTLINMISIQYDIKQKTQSIEQLTSDKEKQELINKELLELIDAGATDEAITDVAQDKLGLALPGERVMTDVGSK